MYTLERLGAIPSETDFAHFFLWTPEETEEEGERYPPLYDLRVTDDIQSALKNYLRVVIQPALVRRIEDFHPDILTMHVGLFHWFSEGAMWPLLQMLFDIKQVYPNMRIGMDGERDHFINRTNSKDSVLFWKSQGKESVYGTEVAELLRRAELAEWARAEIQLLPQGQILGPF
jgi:hypothetical protein